MRWLKSAGLACWLVCAALTLTGCNRHDAQTNASGANGTTTPLVFHFGHQHGGDIIIRARGILEKELAARGVKIDYLEFPAGPQLLEALGVGSIDIGSTGESPPIFAQAAGLPIVYIANNPPTNDRGDGQAILVPQNSPIRSIQDLKGKRIAFQKASSAHNFVIQIVERAGLTYKDIQPVYLSPPDARAAFDSGNIDAWAIWDPFLTIAQQKTGGRILVNSKGIKSAGGFYLSTRDFATKHADLLKIVLQEISDATAWAYDHPQEAGQLYQKATGVDAATWNLVQKHQERTGIKPLTESVIEAQQLTADNYYKIGLLPKSVNIRECVLTPEQYRAIVPVEHGATQTTRLAH
jgi:sulfonate transport system substrate-binding protein